MRAILGQQVSLQAGKRLGTLLVRLCDTSRSPDAESPLPPGLVFPGPEEIAAANLSELPMPNARKRALAALSRAALNDPFLFEPASTTDATVAKLLAIEGVGEWTAQTILLRAAGDPDAFPDGDAGLLRAAAACAGATMEPGRSFELVPKHGGRGAPMPRSTCGPQRRPEDTGRWQAEDRSFATSRSRGEARCPRQFDSFSIGSRPPLAS